MSRCVYVYLAGLDKYTGISCTPACAYKYATNIFTQHNAHQGTYTYIYIYMYYLYPGIAGLSLFMRFNSLPLMFSNSLLLLFTRVVHAACVVDSFAICMCSVGTSKFEFYELPLML